MENIKENIIRIYNKDTQKELLNSDIIIKLHIDNSSNTKSPIYRIFIKDEVIQKNNNFMCEYKCITCERINIVNLNNISRKINNNIINCRTCKESIHEKKQKQSDFMKKNAKNIINQEYIKETIEKQNLLEKINNDQKLFNNMDDDYKKKYFKKFLTIEEFERIKNKIISFQHDKFNDINKFIYFPCISIYNQQKFNPYLYDKDRNVLEKINYINFKCECCSEKFENRDLYIQKNKYKIHCSNCNFTNNIFKIRTCANINLENIRYQSKFEKKLIDFCNTNNILIQNGPNLKYIFNNREHTYRVDFQLPKAKCLIECKDNHIWHKQNLESGKWQAKENTARQFIDKNELYTNYILIFPESFIEKTKLLINMI